MSLRSLLLLGLVLPLLSCSGQKGKNAPQLMVFAAASLRDVAVEVAQAFERDTGVTVRFNFAGSNTLARQIEAAPRADVFVSANTDWVDHLEPLDLTIEGSRRNFLSNQLVIVAHEDSPLRMETGQDLATLEFEHLVVAEPEAVPAGRYAKAWLESLGLWNELKGRVAPTLDVRAALQLGVSDDRFLAIVYATDAQASDDARVVFRVPPEGQPLITYCAVLINRGEGELHPSSDEFMRFLESEAAHAIYKRYGFTAS